MRRHEATGRPLGSRPFERIGVRLVLAFGRGVRGGGVSQAEAKAASRPPQSMGVRAPGAAEA